MRLRVVWWIPIAGVWIAHASGFLQQVGPIFESLDKVIGTVTDMRKLAKVAPAAPMQARSVTPLKKKAAKVK
jgi:hypothetical protein